MKTSIGCVYSFDRTAIIKAEIIEDKIYLTGEFFNHATIRKIAKKLDEHEDEDDLVVWINKHESLKNACAMTINEFDFLNENAKEEITDIYRSLEQDNILEIDDTINVKQPHQRDALCLALKGLDYYNHEEFDPIESMTREDSSEYSDINRLNNRSENLRIYEDE